MANEKTTFADAFAMADQVLYSGVACITDLMVKEGLINLDFADVRAVMREMGKAMMGTGEAEGEKRAMTAAEAAISNPLIDDASMKGAKGLLISITGGRDLTLYEVDEAATRIREEVDQDANIIVGATFDEGLEGIIRVSVVATGIDHVLAQRPPAAVAAEARIAEVAQRLRADNEKLAQRVERAEPVRPVAAAPAAGGAAASGPQRIRSNSAKAAMAAAILPQGTGAEVTIRPLGPKPSLFIDPAVNGPRAAGAGGVHSAATGADAVAQHAHAAHRRTAGPGAERAARAPRRAARRSIRRSGGRRCCSGWPRSVSAAASRTTRRRCRCRRGQQRRCRLCRIRFPRGFREGRRRGKSCDKSVDRSRYPSTPSVGRRRGWTSMVGRSCA